MQVLLLDPAPDGAGVQERDLRVDRRVQRPVHGDQVVAADELVQLDVVDVTALAELRCVQHGEHVVGVDVDLGHVVALDAVVHRDPVEAEHRRQHLDGDLVARRDVDPDDGVLTFQQPRQLHDVVPLDAGIADHQHVHLRHPPFRAQQRSRTPRQRVATVQAYHSRALRRWDDLSSPADISDICFDTFWVSPGDGLYTSTWEPTITVRLRGRLKYSAASAVMAEVARKRRLRHSAAWLARRHGAARSWRRSRVAFRLDPALDLGGLHQPQHLGHVRHVHVAEPGADVGDPVVGVAEVVDRPADLSSARAAPAEVSIDMITTCSCSTRSCSTLGPHRQRSGLLFRG